MDRHYLKNTFLTGISLIIISGCTTPTWSGKNQTSVKAGAPAEKPAPEYAPNDPYFEEGQKTLAANLARKPIDTRAKNVILFIADGMGPTTVAAARIFDGQSQGKSGEEHLLKFETLPHLAMAKTYNIDSQTPDSAGTASAIMTGVKTNIGMDIKNIRALICKAA